MSDVTPASPTCVKDGPRRPQLIRLRTAGGSLITKDTRTQPRSPSLAAYPANLSSRLRLAADGTSPLVALIVLFAGLELIEAAAVVIGSPLQPTPFAFAFYMSLLLRVRYASHRDASLTWPVDKTAVFICIFDRWVFRP